MELQVMWDHKAHLDQLVKLALKVKKEKLDHGAVLGDLEFQVSMELEGIKETEEKKDWMVCQDSQANKAE